MKTNNELRQELEREKQETEAGCMMMIVILFITACGVWAIKHWAW